MVHSPEWATSSSVFAGKQGYSPVWGELVVHFPEWSTGSFDFAGNQGNSPFWSEPVAHFLEWPTGSFDFAGIQGKAPILSELVVHFTEWTTGSFDCMEKTTRIAGGFLHTKKPARRACWLAIRLENLLGQALPLGLN